MLRGNKTGKSADDGPMAIDAEKGPGKTISDKKPGWWRRLGGGEQIKTKGASKSGWQTVERDEKPGSV